MNVFITYYIHDSILSCPYLVFQKIEMILRKRKIPIQRHRREIANKTMQRDAKISDDGVYRYWLSRTWDDAKPKILVIMLKPSTANDIEDDDTIRKLRNKATAWGYGGMYVGNLYTYRTPYPKVLKTVSDPEGPENRKYIRDMIDSGSFERVVYAWGNEEKEPQWLRELVREPYCIALSKKGIPRHPGRLKNGLALVKFRDQ